MKQIALYIGLFLVLSPGLALAQAQPCSPQGYTVFYVNGIFDTKAQANDDANALGRRLGHQYESQPLTVYSAYNPSHIGGLGDLAEALSQMLFSSLSNVDLDSMLRQIAGEDTTQKLVIVGHSQGALYANEIYDYVTNHGESPKSVDVYAVATPASYVAGGGSYVTSQSDAVIFGLALAAQKSGMPVPLPPNMDTFVDPATSAGLTTTHSFISAYLFSAGDRIVADIGNEMKHLQPSSSFATAGGCFTPPSASADTQGQTTLSVLDSVTNGVGIGINLGVTAMNAVANSATAIVLDGIYLAEDLQNAQKSAVANSAATVANPANAEKTDTIINKLYGSSLDGLSAQDKKDLLGSSQGSAVALALVPPKAPATSGVVLGTSTEVTADISAPTSTPSFPKNIFPSSANGPVFGGGGTPPPQSGISVPLPVVTASDDADTVVADDSTSIASSTDTDATDESNASSTTDTDEASSTEDTSASSTPITSDDASSTSAVALPTGAPFTDSFDTYDGTAWIPQPDPYDRLIVFGSDNGSADTFMPEPLHDNDCHSGSCLIATGSTDNGVTAVMFRESGVPQSAGAFTIWARARKNPSDRFIANANIGLCAGASLGCIGANTYFIATGVAPTDDMWHQYYVAWRQGTNMVEGCVLQDDTNAGDCVWESSNNFPLGTQFDGIMLQGGLFYRSVGDEVWFDDLAEAPAQ